MIVYLVEGNSDMEVCIGNFVEFKYVYGVFSSMEKANTIASQLRSNISEHNETQEITITELKIDEPTDDYYFFLCN